MRLAAQRCQGLLQTVEGGTGQADHLLAIVDQLHAGDTQRADQHDIAVIVFAVRRGAAGQTGIGRLHDDDATCCHAGLHHLPLLQQRTGAHHRQHLAFAAAMSPAKAPRGLFASQYMGGADHAVQLRKQRRMAAFTGGRHGHSSRTSRSGLISLIDLAPVSTMATRISFSISSSRLVTPAPPCTARA